MNMETAIIVMAAMISFIAGRMVRDHFIKKKKDQDEEN
jgi:hypothetical protein